MLMLPFQLKLPTYKMMLLFDTLSCCLPGRDKLNTRLLQATEASVVGALSYPHP